MSAAVLSPAGTMPMVSIISRVECISTNANAKPWLLFCGKNGFPTDWQRGRSPLKNPSRVSRREVDAPVRASGPKAVVPIHSVQRLVPVKKDHPRDSLD